MTESKEIIDVEARPQEEEKALTTLTPMTPVEAKAMMESYQEYVAALLTEEDSMAIQGKQFKKKSAWRKLAMASNLSVRVVREDREDLPNGDYAYNFVCEATHPNGRITGGSGSCTAYEKAQWKDGKWVDNYSKDATPNSLHNVRSTAETRAWNRAVSNMIAAGEVSAEEVQQEQAHNYSAPQRTENEKKFEQGLDKQEKALGELCNDCGEGTYVMSQKGNVYCNKKCWLNNNQ